MTAETEGETILDKRYRLLKLLGRGGYGDVYKAFDELLQREVAVKIISARHSASSGMDISAQISQLKREARATAHIDHRNIVATYAIGSDPNGSVYLVMEYIDGKSLSHILSDEGPLPLEQACELFVQIASAVCVLHENGVMHRDLTPRNVIVERGDSEQFCAKILDFGLAKLERKTSTAISRTGRAVGTVGYMSPEQCLGLPFEKRSEIYTFGCLMYECLTGKKAHPGHGPMSLMHTVKEYPLAFKQNAPDKRFPKQLEWIVFRALSKHPDDRYQTFSALHADLRKLSSAMADGHPLPDISEPVRREFPIPPKSIPTPPRAVSFFSKPPPIVRWGLERAPLICSVALLFALACFCAPTVLLQLQLAEMRGEFAIWHRIDLYRARQLAADLATAGDTKSCAQVLRLANEMPVSNDRDIALKGLIECDLSQLLWQDNQKDNASAIHKDAINQLSKLVEDRCAGRAIDLAQVWLQAPREMDQAPDRKEVKLQLCYAWTIEKKFAEVEEYIKDKFSEPLTQGDPEIANVFAFVLEKQGKFEDAAQVCEAAMTLMDSARKDQTDSAGTSISTTIALSAAQDRLSAMQSSLAVDDFHRALKEAASRHDVGGQIVALSGLAKALSMEGSAQQIQDCHQRSSALFQELRDNSTENGHYWLCSPAFDLAVYYQERKQMKPMLNALQSAAELAAHVRTMPEPQDDLAQLQERGDGQLIPFCLDCLVNRSWINDAERMLAAAGEDQALAPQVAGIRDRLRSVSR